MGDTLQECRDNVIATVEMSCDTGFIVHPIKSLLEPTQIIEYLGFIINSVDMTVRVNERQAKKIADACMSLMSCDSCTLLKLAKVVGLLVASFPGVEFGPVFYRKLDNAKNRALKDSKGNFNSCIEINSEMKDDLNWWIENIQYAYNPISHGNPSMIIYSDASKTGWGVACNGIKSGGIWDANEANLHINMLELKAAWFGLRCFASELKNIHIQLKIDNTTALAYIGNMGGKLTPLNDLAREIWLWCKDRNIWLSVAYIASADNYDADYESRLSRDNIEWKLNTKVFKEICDIFGKPKVDLFASRLNFQLDLYVSWKPDPFAMAVDAFTLDWASIDFYAFPPFSMIHKVLQKIDLDNVKSAIVIVPYWTTQTWFPKLGRMLISCPFLLPRSPETLHHPVKRCSHELTKLQLLACHLSSDTLRTREFRLDLQRSSCVHGGARHRDSTLPTSKNGLNFVVHGTQIICHHLS